jgi:arsenical pump membrane protein
MIANAASFVLPISNPANLVVFHRDMPPLGEWLADFAVPSVLAIAATFVVLRILFRKELGKKIALGAEESGSKNAKLTANGKLVLVGLALMVVVLLAASAMKKELGLPTCIAAVAIAAVVLVKARSNPVKLLREISWATLALVAGLFVMVDAVESMGALNVTQRWLAWAQGLGEGVSVMVVGFAVGVANNVVNNLPLGLVAGGTLGAAHVKGLMASAVLIGVDLGPNLAVTGSLATILWLIAIKREQGSGGEKVDVSFWSFLKVGAIAMPVAMIAALSGAVVMRMVVGR